MAKGKEKRILIVLDGVADRPCSELGNKTPLQAANTPNLDYFAKSGKSGFMYPIKEGIAPESDVAVTAILGYDPYKYFTGRGPLEAYGAGINLSEGDLALRANFGTIKDGKIVDRRVGRTLTTKEAEALASAINKHVQLEKFKFIFKPTIQHRGVLVVRGSFSDNITNTDPAYEKWGSFSVAKPKDGKIKDSMPLDDDEISKLSANLVNSFVEQSRKILENHPVNRYRIKQGLLPANIILTRDAGTKVPQFPQKKEKWLAIAGMPLEIGISKLAGMKVAEFTYPEAGKDAYKTLYEGLDREIRAAVNVLGKKLSSYDNFYIHIKETDVPGHDGLPLEKKKMIEILDKKLFGWLRTRKNKSLIICVTADHSTPCSLKMHSSDPVPVLVYGKGSDGTAAFDEKSCMKGSLGKIYGKDLLKNDNIF